MLSVLHNTPHTPHSGLLPYSPRGSGCCLLLGLQTSLDPSVPYPTVPASELLFPEKAQLLAFPLHSDESQCSLLVTMKADSVTVIGGQLIPNPNLNCVSMNNQTNTRYLGLNFSRLSLITNNCGATLVKAGIRAGLGWCQSGQGRRDNPSGSFSPGDFMGISPETGKPAPVGLRS